MIDNKVELIKEHMEEVMRILEIPVTDSTRNTPLRLAKMWANELFENVNGANLDKLRATMKTFPNEYESEMVIVRDIPFNSTCEHHWLPFSGVVTVGYVPDAMIVGLSKIPRIVRYFSRMPQLQEKLTTDIGNHLIDVVHPKAVFVEVTSTHQCVKCRGAESDCATSTYFKWARGDLSKNEVDRLYSEFKARL